MAKIERHYNLSQLEPVQESYRALAQREAQLEAVIKAKNPNFNENIFETAVRNGRDPGDQGVQDKAALKQLKEVAKIKQETAKAYSETLAYFNDKVNADPTYEGMKDKVRNAGDALTKIDLEEQQKADNTIAKVFKANGANPLEAVQKDIEKQENLMRDLGLVPEDGDKLNASTDPSVKAHYQTRHDLYAKKEYWQKAQEQVQKLAELTPNQAAKLKQALESPQDEAKLKQFTESLKTTTTALITPENLQKAIDGQLPEAFKPSSDPAIHNGGANLLEYHGFDKDQKTEIRVKTSDGGHIAIARKGLDGEPVKLADGSYLAKSTQAGVAEKYEQKAFKDAAGNVTHYTTVVTPMTWNGTDWVAASNKKASIYTAAAGEKGREKGVAMSASATSTTSQVAIEQDNAIKKKAIETVDVITKGQTISAEEKQKLIKDMEKSIANDPAMHKNVKTMEARLKESQEAKKSVEEASKLGQKTLQQSQASSGEKPKSVDVAPIADAGKIKEEKNGWQKAGEAFASVWASAQTMVSGVPVDGSGLPKAIGAEPKTAQEAQKQLAQGGR